MKKIIVVAIIAISTSFVVSSCNSASSQNNLSSVITGSSMIYTCKMHQDVVSDHSGQCPVCGMTLVKQKITRKEYKLVQDGDYIKVKD